MSLFKRLLAIVIAYICSAIASGIIIGAIFIGVIIQKDFVTIISGFAQLGSVTAIVAFPVALPIIAFAELQRTGPLRFFVGAGFFLGLLLTVLFSVFVFEEINFLFSVLIISSSLFGAVTYWLVGWRLLRPDLEVPLSAEQSYD